MDKYKALIGLEMHCQISRTRSKVFSSAKNGYNEMSNSNVRPIDMAFPGTLPVANKEAIKKALMMSIILNCEQPKYIYFERKNYYYPDLPKGYQITQESNHIPVGVSGSLRYEYNDEYKTIRINNIHLEEDAASSDHYSNYSAIDYNREGVPLLELITYPEFHNADEAVAFLETVRSIYQYANISEADSKKGQIRCDVNVSIMDSSLDEKDSKNWGTKVETKNVNSFSAVRDTINYEIKRQIELKENGTYNEMPQQTRRWDEESGTTIYMRNKVDAIDYKYFVEPNIPKFKISDEWLNEIKSSIPTLAYQRKEKYVKEYGLTKKDATTLVKEKSVSDYFDECVELNVNPKSASNWITTRLLGYINKLEISINDIYLKPSMLKDLIDMVDSNKISSKQAKDVFNQCLEEKKDPTSIVNELGLTQNSDDSLLRNIIIELLNSNEDNILKYKAGRTNVLDFFVGQVMKQTRGTANPSMATQIIIEELDKR